MVGRSYHPQQQASNTKAAGVVGVTEAHFTAVVCVWSCKTPVRNEK